MCEVFSESAALNRSQTVAGEAPDAPQALLKERRVTCCPHRDYLGDIAHFLPEVLHGGGQERGVLKYRC